MPRDDGNTTNSYDVLNDRAGFGSDTLGYMSATRLAVASAFDEEIQEEERFYDTKIEDRTEDEALHEERLSSLSHIDVDDSEFTNSDMNLRQRADEPDSYREKKKGQWTHINTPDFDFTVHGSHFSGKRGHYVEGADVAVTPGLAIDFTPVKMKADPVSESAYIDDVGGSGEPIVAYYDKKRSVLHHIPTKVLRGRDVSVLSQDAMFIRSNAHVDMVMDEKSGYKLSAEGFGVSNDHLYFKNAVIHRENSEDNSIEQIAGRVEIHDADIFLDRQPWGEKLGLEDTDKVKKRALDKLEKAEKELGLDSAGEDEVTISLEDAVDALEEAGEEEVATELTNDFEFEERESISDDELRLHPFKKYRQVFFAYNNQQYDAEVDAHTDEDGNVDVRVSDRSLFFDYDAPYALSTFTYILGFFALIFGDDPYELNAVLDEKYPNKKEHDEKLAEIQQMNSIEVNAIKAKQRMAFALKWLKNVASGNFDKLTPTANEKLNMGLQSKNYADANIISNLGYFIPIFPPMVNGYIILAPDFNFNLDWDVYLEPSPNSPNKDTLEKKAMAAVMPLLSSAGPETYKVAGETAIDEILKLVELQFGAYGALTGDAALNVSAGVGANAGLLSADASLYAGLSLSGTGKNSALASAEMVQRMKLGEYDPGVVGAGSKIGERALEVKFGIGLDGQVGTTGKIASPIFNQTKKKLWDKNFASWDIAELTFSKKFSNALDAGLMGNKSEESVFNISVFHQEVKKKSPRTYGFKMTLSNSDTKKILSSGNTLVEKNRELLINAGKLIDADPESIDLEELEKIYAQLEKAETDQQLLSERTAFVHAQNEQSETYQAAKKDVEVDLNKSISILSKIDKLSEDEKKSFDDDAITGYGVDIADFNYFVDNAIKEEVISEFATPENIKAYEEEKMEEELADVKHNIGLVIDFKDEDYTAEVRTNDQGEIELDDVSDENIARLEDEKRRRMVNNYLKNKKGFDTIESRLTDYADPKALIEYEIKANDEETKGLQKRIVSILDKISELGISPNQYSEELVDFYRDKLDGKEFFERNFAEFMSLQDLIEYEKNTMFEDDMLQRLYITRTYLKNVDFENFSDTDQSVVDEMRERLKGLLSEEEVASSLAMTATPEELIDFENRRIDSMLSEELTPTGPVFISDLQKKNAKKLAKLDPAKYGHILDAVPYDQLDNQQKVVFLSEKLHKSYSFEAQQRANANLRKTSGVKKALGFGGIAASGVFFVTDALRHLVDRITDTRLKDVLRKNVPIEELLKFEESLIEKDPQGMTKEGKKHKNRAQLLRRYIGRINQFRDEDAKQEYIDTVRERYFDGTIDVSSVVAALTYGGMDSEKTANDDFLNAIVDDTYKPSDSYYEQMIPNLENAIKHNIAGPFMERVDALKQMVKQNMSQSYIYEKYVDMAGNSFWKGGMAFAESKYETVHSNDPIEEKKATIDTLSGKELMMLAENMLREKTMQSFMARSRKSAKNAVKNMAGETVTSWVGADAAVSEDQMIHINYGGKIEKIDRLEELLSQMNDPANEKFKDMNEDQKKAYVVKFYREELASGVGITDSLMGKDSSVGSAISRISPEMILKYEYSKIDKASERRMKRIEFLKTKKAGDDMSDYRKMVLSDGEGVGAAFNKINAAIRENYRTGADKFLKAADVLNAADIVDYENKRAERLTKKRNGRMKAVDELLANKAESSNVDIYHAYYNASGGAKGFIKKYEAQINEKIEEKKKNLNKFEMFHRFETLKRDMSKEDLGVLTKPVTSLKNQTRNINNLMIVTKDRKEKIRKLIEQLKLSASAANAQPAQP